MYTERATPQPSGPVQTPAHVLARKVWAAFAFTFVLSRILVFLIMSGRIPDVHSHLRGTHLHHLNSGLVLLPAVAALLFLNRPTAGGLPAPPACTGGAWPRPSANSGLCPTLTADSGHPPAS